MQGILDEHLRRAAKAPGPSWPVGHYPNVPIRTGVFDSEFRNHATVYNFEPFLDGRIGMDSRSLGTELGLLIG